MNDTENLTILRSYYKEHGVLPSYRFMCVMFGYKSKDSIHSFVERMKGKGVLDTTPEKKLKPGKLF